MCIRDSPRLCPKHHPFTASPRKGANTSRSRLSLAVRVAVETRNNDMQGTSRSRASHDCDREVQRFGHVEWTSAEPRFPDRLATAVSERWSSPDLVDTSG